MPLETKIVFGPEANFIVKLNFELTQGWMVETSSFQVTIAGGFFVYHVIVFRQIPEE